MNLLVNIRHHRPQSLKLFYRSCIERTSLCILAVHPNQNVISTAVPTRLHTIIMQTAAALLALSSLAMAHIVERGAADIQGLITQQESRGFNGAAASFWVTNALAGVSVATASLGRLPADAAVGPAFVTHELQDISNFPEDQRSIVSAVDNAILSLQNGGAVPAAVTTDAVSAVSSAAQASGTAVSGPAATGSGAGSQAGASSGFVTSAPAATGTDSSGAAAPQTDASGATMSGSAASGASGTQSIASGGASKPTDVAFMAMAGAVVGVAGLAMGL